MVDLNATKFGEAKSGSSTPVNDQWNAYRSTAKPGETLDRDTFFAGAVTTYTMLINAINAGKAEEVITQLHKEVARHAAEQLLASLAADEAT